MVPSEDSRVRLDLWVSHTLAVSVSLGTGKEAFLRSLWGVQPPAAASHPECQLLGSGGPSAPHYQLPLPRLPTCSTSSHLLLDTMTQTTCHVDLLICQSELTGWRE